jgi:hypothetical protein
VVRIWSGRGITGWYLSTEWKQSQHGASHNNASILLVGPAADALSAHAEPLDVGFIAYFVAEYYVVVLAVGAYIYGNAQQRRAKRRARDEYNAGLQDRTITRVATEAPHVYIYGQARVGSAIVAIFTKGDKDQYKYLVCVHAAHECEAIDEIYIASKPLGTLDGSGLPVGGAYYRPQTNYANPVIHGSASFTVPPGTDFSSIIINDGERSFTVSGNTVTVDGWAGEEYAAYYVYTSNVSTVRVSKHLGTSTDGADAMLLAEVGDQWPATAVLRGFCYTVVRLDLNQPEFQGGIPAVEVLIRGKKVLDPRTGITAYSANNALVPLRLPAQRHVRRGCGRYSGGAGHHGGQRLR